MIVKKNRTLIMTLSKAFFINNNDRNDNDYYPTAPIATYILQDNYNLKNDVVLEPACGRGWVSYELNKCGIQTVSKDLFEYENALVEFESNEDFLLSKKDDRCTAMVTNPPFKQNMAQSFVEHSIKLYDKTIIFARITFLESARRCTFFNENPFSQLIVLSSRIQCNEQYFRCTKDQIGGMVAYGWFIWDDNPIKNKISFVDPKKHIKKFIEKRGDQYI